MSWRSKLTPAVGATGSMKLLVNAGMRVTPSITLSEPLDAGGMGSIWRAHHEGLGVDVAVKLIAPELLSHDRDKALARFRLEARSAARNRSPHVVQMLDHGITDGDLPYIVMELLEGECLADRLERDLVLEPPRVSVIMQQTCRALDRAHQLGIVHRDIKPDNIFLCSTHDDGDDFIKVLDFGVAKDVLALERKLTMDGTFIGTPEFLAPEHIIDCATEPSVDLWALAVVAYLCITGELPFVGRNLEAVCEAVLAAEIIPPSEIVDDITPELDAWFAKALARDPEDRFATAREFAQAFGAAVPQSLAAAGSWDRGLVAPPASSSRGGEDVDTQTLERVHSRRRTVYGLAMGLGVVALVIGLWVSLQRPAAPVGTAGAQTSGGQASQKENARNPSESKPTASASPDGATVLASAAPAVSQARASSAAPSSKAATKPTTAPEAAGPNRRTPTSRRPKPRAPAPAKPAPAKPAPAKPAPAKPAPAKSTLRPPGF